MESPTFAWFLTETVLPEVMKTISAEAKDEPAATSTHAAIASRTVLSTFIGTHDPTTWLVRVSRNATVEVSRTGSDPRSDAAYFGSMYA